MNSFIHRSLITIPVYRIFHVSKIRWRSCLLEAPRDGDRGARRSAGRRRDFFATQPNSLRAAPVLWLGSKMSSTSSMRCFGGVVQILGSFCDCAWRVLCGEVLHGFLYYNHDDDKESVCDPTILKFRKFVADRAY